MTFVARVGCANQGRLARLADERIDRLLAFRSADGENLKGHEALLPVVRVQHPLAALLHRFENRGRDLLVVLVHTNTVIEDQVKLHPLGIVEHRRDVSVDSQQVNGKLLPDIHQGSFRWLDLEILSPRAQTGCNLYGRFPIDLKAGTLDHRREIRNELAVHIQRRNELVLDTGIDFVLGRLFLRGAEQQTLLKVHQIVPQRLPLIVSELQLFDAVVVQAGVDHERFADPILVRLVQNNLSLLFVARVRILSLVLVMLALQFGGYREGPSKRLLLKGVVVIDLGSKEQVKLLLVEALAFVVHVALDALLLKWNFSEMLGCRFLTELQIGDPDGSNGFGVLAVRAVILGKSDSIGDVDCTRDQVGRRVVHPQDGRRRAPAHAVARRGPVLLALSLLEAQRQVGITQGNAVQEVRSLRVARGLHARENDGPVSKAARGDFGGPWLGYYFAVGAFHFEKKNE